MASYTSSFTVERDFDAPPYYWEVMAEEEKERTGEPAF